MRPLKRHSVYWPPQQRSGISLAHPSLLRSLSILRRPLQEDTTRTILNKLASALLETLTDSAHSETLTILLYYTAHHAAQLHQKTLKKNHSRKSPHPNKPLFINILNTLFTHYAPPTCNLPVEVPAWAKRLRPYIDMRRFHFELHAHYDRTNYYIQPTTLSVSLLMLTALLMQQGIFSTAFGMGVLLCSLSWTAYTTDTTFLSGQHCQRLITNAIVHYQQALEHAHLNVSRTYITQKMQGKKINLFNQTEKIAFTIGMQHPLEIMQLVRELLAAIS